MAVDPTPIFTVLAVAVMSAGLFIAVLISAIVSTIKNVFLVTYGKTVYM